MQNYLRYINLSWAVVGICENARQPLLVHIPGIDKDEAAAVEHYVIGYMAFWHIAFVDEDCLVPCNDDALRNDARRKIDRYIADHSPVENPMNICSDFHLGRHFLGLAMNAFVGNLVTLQPNKH